MSITAVLIVYNEAKRLEATLRCLGWCDEIIVFDKNSSDDTVQIAKKYASRIFSLDHQDFRPEDSEAFLREAHGDWVLTITASDLIHPALAKKIRGLIDLPAFPYDVIDVPFRRYVLGLQGPRSPWYSKLNPGILFRKNIASVDHTSVHGAVVLKTSKHYQMNEPSDHCIYHLTHASMDALMDRHLIYCRAEAQLFHEDKPLWRAIVPVFRGIYIVLFRRKTFLMGWNGVALAMAYLSYWMLNFVYIWERRCAPSGKYTKIRKDILSAWEKESGKESA
jgi:glycosyltransferase involved in cell wall biosynthesis